VRVIITRMISIFVQFEACPMTCSMLIQSLAARTLHKDFLHVVNIEEEINSMYYTQSGFE